MALGSISHVSHLFTPRGAPCWLSDELAWGTCKWASPTRAWPTAAVTALNVGLLDVLLRKRIRPESPSFERRGTPLWMCVGTARGPAARPRGGHADHLPRTWAALTAQDSSPGSSAPRLKFCGSRTRSQRDLQAHRWARGFW